MAVRRLLVLGATGGVDPSVVEPAAGLGLELTALVRSPGKLPAVARLRVVTVAGDEIGVYELDGAHIRGIHGLTLEAESRQIMIAPTASTGRDVEPDHDRRRR